MQNTDLQFLELIKLDEIVCRRNFNGIYFYDSKLCFAEEILSRLCQSF